MLTIKYTVRVPIKFTTIFSVNIVKDHKIIIIIVIVGLLVFLHYTGKG